MLEAVDRGLQVSTNEPGVKESVQPIMFEEVYTIAES